MERIERPINRKILEKPTEIKQAEFDSKGMSYDSDTLFVHQP